jgi:hypothetical protein
MAVHIHNEVSNETDDKYLDNFMEENPYVLQ